jgi:hypothetical protein
MHGYLRSSSPAFFHIVHLLGIMRVDKELREPAYPSVHRGVSIIAGQADDINVTMCVGFYNWLHTMFRSRPSSPPPSRRQRPDREAEEEEEIEELVALDII